MKKGIVLKLAMFVAAFAISTFAPSMTAAAASYDDEFVALINQKRAANGLQPVSLNSTFPTRRSSDLVFLPASGWPPRIHSSR